MNQADIAISEDGGVRRLVFNGKLDTQEAGLLWSRALKLARGEGQAATAVDLAGITHLDTTGAALVLAVADGRPVENASPSVQAVIQRAQDALAAPRPAPPPKPLGFVTSVGAWAFGVARQGIQGIAFIGEAALMVLNVVARPRLIRLAELLRHFDEVGTRAFPLTALLGVLIGVILAFQFSNAMRQFGAQLYIPSLVGIALLRELGPLLAAVILAGRTGSAFAAELGTMTVNEEIDALRIMGIDPMAMLVFPRLVAAMLVLPVLALLMNLAGLIGTTLVMMSLGFSFALVKNQLIQWLTLGALVGGLGKAAVFGLVIAGIGCRAGLAAGRGPRAVGDAATAAVVGGIIAIVLLDGIFAVLFYRLGW